jgi:kynurenine 3-monooxygenase
MADILIVGSGLVGSVLSIYLARAGYRTLVFDRSVDYRRLNEVSDRSINLTLCERGLQALDRIGMAEEVLEISVPVRGRVIHAPDGATCFQPYGNNGEAIYSVSRNQLNRLLLNRASTFANIELHFQEECVGLDLATTSLRVKDLVGGAESTFQSPHIFAADGAFSAVRYFLQRRTGFNYSQTYSAQAYKELSMPATATGDWPLEPNALHIWPRGHHMLIAFPNADRTFTCSLHMPCEGRGSHALLRSGKDVLRLFRNEFPDAVDLMPRLVDDYLRRPQTAMVTIRCSPWTIGEKVIFIGDAAHAIYPSYGQGANAGFEDCRILMECLERHGHSWKPALAEYQALRKVNTDAIADLSDRHFIELRDLVGDQRFLLRKEVERRINKLYPDKFKDLYSMVTFTTMPYADAMKVDQRQKMLVDQVLGSDDFEQLWRHNKIDAAIHQIMRAQELEPVSG